MATWSAGEMIEESDVLENILFTLTKPYKPKKSTLKEYHYLNNYIIDQLISTLSTYEIGEMEDMKSYWREVAFNISSILGDEVETNENQDEIEENFVGRPKWGIQKYKGKLPLECFNCGRIGYYASKCTYTEDYRMSKDVEKKNCRFRRNEFKIRMDDKEKKSLYSSKAHSLEEEEEEDVEESNEEYLFMTIEEKYQECIE